ncbi:hypothetical protein [Cupriavidus sp. D39]|uniref:hypothetical protein n=1 Tax=Cupriavidus sp. D39 TaxID=2997877 RepID=UPI00226FB89B|nr:hypothetical protein [Cupriavidus sp. D39]MCY0854293.1 hypothetical protein [Cupriavidus sp. D39]
MIAPSSYQISLLQHTIGVSQFQREPYRNHFVASPGHSDMPYLLQLCDMHLMERARRPGFLHEDDTVFRVTEAGKALAIASLPTPRKRSRYEQYLHADCMESFGEFLCGARLPEFEQTGWNSPTGEYGTEYRMFRRVSGSDYNRDVEGGWFPTKKEAKASYKAALKAVEKTHQQVKREWSAA